MLMSIVDKRSMINSSLFGATERNVRQCIYGQQNIGKLWGRLPVMLLFGNDYQLLPVEKTRAIEGYVRFNATSKHRLSRKSPASQFLGHTGQRLLIEDTTQNILVLDNHNRFKDKQF